MQSAVRTLILLLATVVLGLSPLGFVQVPSSGGYITFLHLPMLLAATLESPLAAAVVGAAFGLVAGSRYEMIPLPYHVVPRVVAGLVAGLTFKIVGESVEHGTRLTKASAAAATLGTVANTILMCSVALLLGKAQAGELLSVAIVHGAFELAAALLVVVPITIALGGSKK